MRLRSKTKWVLAITYATMLAIVASACGGTATVAPATSRPAASGAAVGTPTAAPTAPPKPVTIKFGFASISLLWATYQVADGLGIFKKYNLDAQRTLSPTSTALQAGVVAGSVDAVGVSTDTVVFVSAKQPGVVSVAYSQLNGSPYSLVVDPSITKLQDLKGKVIVVSAANTADGFVGQQILGSAGLKAGTDYAFLVSVGGGPGRLAAMTAKQAQGMLAQEPEVTTLKAQGFRELASANDIPVMRDASTFSLVVNSQWAKANKDAVVTLLKAWMEATNAMYDPAKKSAVVATIATQMSITPELVTTALDNWIGKLAIYNKTCKAVPSQIEAIVQQAINEKVIEAPGPKTADMLLDPSYCEAALK